MSEDDLHLLNLGLAAAWRHSWDRSADFLNLDNWQ